LFIGIDIGGTFTDGVLIAGREVLKSVKVPTQEFLSYSIEDALKEILLDVDPHKIEQVTLSTTLITNLIMQDQTPQTGMLLLPGPGANPEQLNFACEYKILSGAIDYRGRLIKTVNLNEVKEACDYFAEQQIQHIVVACKFSQRNPALEKEICQFVQKNYPEFKVITSHEVSGLLNWVRRANGACYTLATREACHEFREKINKTLTKFNLNCPLFILKADGGTLPIEISLQYPLETIFSGPAASALGALACNEEQTTAVVIDIGGTTTDLALLLDGKPLLAENGATIKSYPLPVRSLAVSSLELGGDTSLIIKEGKIGFAPRQGSALCIGGPVLTITDVLVYCGYSEIASPDLIKGQVEAMAEELKITPPQLTKLVLEMFIGQLETKLETIFRIWEEEPAYRIWQVLSAEKERPEKLICLGGPAGGIGRYWAEKNNWQVIIPKYSAVANAIGAALAKPTLKIEFFADTERRIYSTNIGALQGTLLQPLRYIDDAKKFFSMIFQATAKERHLAKDADIETLYEEGFNVVRDGQTKGRIFQIGLQTVPGIRTFLQEGE